MKTTRKPFCLCLHQAENNLPRTKFCRRPCGAQRMIMEDREKEEPILKTSQEWYELVPKEFNLVIMDPDGWDRQNYEYSFNEEKITKDEFMMRVCNSTVTCSMQLYLANW